MSVTVAEMLLLIDGLAPFQLAKDWDNVGLLAGRRDARVERVLCALDLTQAVLEEAVLRGAELIVTHHPILFRGRKNLAEDDPEGRLLAALTRANIAMIAAHTNYDAAEEGINAALCEKLGVLDACLLEEGVRVGDVREQSLADFAADVARKLGGAVRRYGDANRRIRRVAVLGGAGGDYAPIALQAGADVFVTGETGYHDALSSLDAGMCTLEAGHAATEFPGVAKLARGLQIAANTVQYKVKVMESAIEPFL